MKRIELIVLMAIMTATQIYAQEGELVSFDPETSQSYYTRTADYAINDDGAYSGGIVSYHDNGKTEETGFLYKGKKSGVWVKYDTDGNRVAQAQYNLGQKDGVWKIWDNEGVLRLTMEFDEGKRVGTWQFYNESGELLKEKSYN